MQRRRQQQPQTSTPTHHLDDLDRHPRLPSRTNNNTSSSTGGRHDPAPPLMHHGIELRERPAHGTSSSISGVYQRAPSAADALAYRAPAYQPQPAVSDTIFIMKPIVGAMQAWSCVVISVFAIIILSVLGVLFKNNHHEMVGGIEDPENGPEVAGTIFLAVIVYVCFLVFCGLQGMLHLRENRRGAIALS